MAVVDLDKLIEKNVKDFSLRGEVYQIRPISYRQTIRMSQLEDSIEEEQNAEKILNFQIEYINLVIPEMTKEVLMETKMPQIRRIQEMIREVLSGEPQDAELEYYREKYKDEYRKNLERVGEETE